MGRKNAAVKIACENRKARHDYFIHETYEAGLELKGTEVKSLRAGKANLKDSYGEIKNGEVFIQNMHISPYEQGNIFNHDALRPRKLLLHKAEIVKLFSKTREKGFTLVPLKIYFKRVGLSWSWPWLVVSIIMINAVICRKELSREM